jgi:hypothetical protein
MPVLLGQATEILERLLDLLKSENNGKLLSFTESYTDEISSILKWHKSRLVAYSRSAEYIHQRTQSTTQLLASTLSLRDQVVAKDQTNSMLRLNKSVVFITIVTLFYLPASFLSVSISSRRAQRDSTYEHEAAWHCLDLCNPS